MILEEQGSSFCLIQDALRQIDRDWRHLAPHRDAFRLELARKGLRQWTCSQLDSSSNGLVT